MFVIIGNRLKYQMSGISEIGVRTSKIWQLVATTLVIILPYNINMHSYSMLKI